MESVEEFMEVANKVASKKQENQRKNKKFC